MENLLALTRSEYGFIGEIRIDAEGNQILRTEAITDISWNEATRDLYEKHAATGMEFRNLDTLFGEVIKTSKPVIANDPSSDPRSAGIPEGHPPLNAFLGVPVFNGEKLIGMYGVANRPGGYDLDLVEYLEPFSTACGSMIESLRNLEQKRHAEKKLRQLSYGIESAGEAIVITDKDAVIQYVNPEFTRLTGYTEKEAVGQKPSVLKSDRHPREFYEDMWQKITSGQAWSNELTNRRKDGTLYEAALTIAPIHDDDQELEGFVAIQSDITEKKQAEKEIKILARFPDENPGPVIRISRDGIIRYANKASRPLLDFWGCEMNEPLPDDLGRSVSDMIENDDCQEIEVKTADKVFSLIFSPISESEYLNIYGVDITQKKTLEHKLMLSQKLEAVGKLAGGIAHDFNNILTAIIGYSEQALDKLGDHNDLAEDIKEILKAGERAASLTRQLLTFSRKQILELKVVSLNEVIEDMWKMLRRLISENIELSTVLSPSLGSIRADVGQIEQVIMNLAINARDAMPDGGRLTIETANVDLDKTYADNHIAVKPGAYVMLAVSDTGSGMDEQTRERVFEPFFTTKELGKGTGLGLSTIYGIVKQSEGNIWVYSEPGKGTSFKIYFPIVSEGPAVCESPKSESLITQGSETILLVEDEDAVRNLASRILSRNGYIVFEACDGIEALEISKRIPDPIHLLITDVVMPRMGGCELAKHLISSRPETRVLYMSGYTDDAIVQNGVLEKGVAFLQKPFTVSSLASKAREVLGATEQRAENNKVN